MEFRQQPKNVATLIDSLYLPARHKCGLFGCVLSCETGPASIAITADAVPGLIVGRTRPIDFGTVLGGGFGNVLDGECRNSV
jgi:hypothetical protein